MSARTLESGRAPAIPCWTARSLLASGAWKEAVAAAAIAACLLGAALAPVLRASGCHDAFDHRVSSWLVGVLDDGGSILETRERLRAAALAGAPEGRWDAPWDRVGEGALACDSTPAPSPLAMAW